MSHGGARPGAGRKPKAQKYGPQINKAEKKIVDKLPEIVDAMLELALGVTVQEVDKKGNEIVYTQTPDRAAGEYLMNRIMGKPVERNELTGKDGAPLPGVSVREVVVKLKSSADD